MKVESFEIEGPKLITLDAHHDDRGFFVERFQKERFKAHGLPHEFVQDNYSRSCPRVLRGLHYQYNPPQGKLITVLSGRIFDVAVDIRQTSPTFGKHIQLELAAETPQWFWIPPGFAHGFCVLGDQPADILYKVDQYYHREGESGIRWNDPDLQISWPVKEPLLSPRDIQLQSFAASSNSSHETRVSLR